MIGKTLVKPQFLTSHIKMLCCLLLFEEPPPQTGEGNKRLYINVVANWTAYLFFIIFPYLVESESFPMERARFRFTPCKKFITNLTVENSERKVNAMSIVKDFVDEVRDFTTDAMIFGHINPGYTILDFSEEQLSSLRELYESYDLTQDEWLTILNPELEPDEMESLAEIYYNSYIETDIEPE